MSRIEHVEPAASAAASSAPAGVKALATTLAGGGLMAGGGITANDAAVLGGLVIALLGLLLQWHFQRRRDKREQAEHQMRALEHEARMAERGYYDAG